VGAGVKVGEGSGDLALDRLVFFSDAVFAIAITLLVLEIRVPDLPYESVAASWRRFFALWPSFFAYVMSFFVIGRFWMGHHERFRSLRHFDDRLMWPNTLYLMAIAFMPFTTAFLGANLGRFVPALVYNLSMLLLSVLALWLARRIKQVSGHGDALEGLDLVLASLACVGLSFVIAPLSQWGMMTVPLWSRLEKAYFSRRAASA
jgi:uncharacterized membrane protein